MSQEAEIKSVQLSLRGPCVLEGLIEHDVHFKFLKANWKIYKQNIDVVFAFIAQPTVTILLNWRLIPLCSKSFRSVS